MIRNDPAGLPLDLGDGLVLRWATADDAEQIIAFNTTSPCRWPGRTWPYRSAPGLPT
jgi:hypothetical protein